MSKHSPAPWTVDGRFIRAAMKQKIVAEVPEGGIMHRKIDTVNARLIAAAPDLLEACKEIANLDMIEEGTAPLDGLVTDSVRFKNVEDFYRMRELLIAAIAKAEGEAK